MAKNTFRLSLTIGYHEAEIIVKALKEYGSAPEIVKDLIGLIEYQLNEAKGNENERDNKQR